MKTADGNEYTFKVVDADKFKGVRGKKFKKEYGEQSRKTEDSSKYKEIWHNKGKRAAERYLEEQDMKWLKRHGKEYGFDVETR